MATIDKYVIQMDVQGQQNVDRLNKSLSGMGGIIAGIGISAFITSVIRMSDAISDLAGATGLAVSEIASFQGALQQAGGKADDAGKMIAAFYQQVDKAATGSEQAQKSLAKVGITLTDLANLSEKDLLSKALATLKEMAPGAERTAAGMDVLGKAFRNIDPKILEEAFRTGDFTAAQDAITKIANLADATAVNFRNLQIAGAQVFASIMSSLEPFVGKMEDGIVSVQQFEKILKVVAASFAVAFAASTVGVITSIISAVRVLNGVLKANAVVQAGITALQGPKGWAVLAGSAVAATAAIVALNRAMGDTNDIAAEGGAKPGAGPGNEGPKRKVQLYTDEELQARKQALTVAQQTTQQQIAQNKAAQDYQRIINDTIGMDQQQADQIKLNAQLEQDAASKILDLTKQIDVERSKGRGTNQGVIAELEKQKQQVIDNLAVTKQLKTEELGRLQVIKDQVNNSKMLLEQVNNLNNVAQKSQALQIQQAVAVGTITEEQAQRRTDLLNETINNTNKLNQLQTQLNQATDQGLTQEANNIRELMNLEKDRHTAEMEYIKNKQKTQDQLRQSEAAGAKAAIESITRSMDPFQVAQMQVNSLWSNMGTAIDRFVDGSTMKFSDLTKSILRDLVKIELKAQASKLFSAAFGGGGFLGSLFGFANGGEPPVNKPSIVGEKGPELFVPKSAGTIIPNNKLAAIGAGGGSSSNSVVNYITNNNVSAIDGQSVARFFAENRRTMLGSMQMAQKELPYGNR